MEHETDLLERVVVALNERKGSLRTLADECGIPYDTVLRVKNREGDPGYSKVRTLALLLFPEPSRRITDKVPRPSKVEG